MKYCLKKIKYDEKELFYNIALKYFSEIIYNFTPTDEFYTHYFNSILSKKNLYLYWLIYNDKIIGFSLIGKEKHRFLPKQIGKIYEFYILPEYRNKGHASYFANMLINKIKKLNVQKIELEIIINNTKAKHFWEKNGFEMISYRYLYKK